MLFVCYPRCSTCKKAQKWLDEHQLPYTVRDIKEDNPTLQELETWHQASGLPLKKFFNTSGQLYRSLGLSKKLPEMSQAEQYALLASDGLLVKRPILVLDDGQVLVGFQEAAWAWASEGAAMKLLVSACLLGVGCRYDGGHNQLPQLKELLKTHTCIPICPEQMGGLPTPRPPAERQGSRVVTRDGEDVTEAFLRGTAEVLRLADLYRCKAALLKERSPSCGCGQIYDGTFSKTLVEGDGMAAQMLKKHGLTVYGESQIGELVNTRPFFYSI